MSRPTADQTLAATVHVEPVHAERCIRIIVRQHDGQVVKSFRQALPRGAHPLHERRFNQDDVRESIAEFFAQSIVDSLAVSLLRFAEDKSLAWGPRWWPYGPDGEQR